MLLNQTEFDTKYGKLIIPNNDHFFVNEFLKGKYWADEEIIQSLSLIDKTKNVLEFGSHIGTHTIPFAKHINDNCTLYSFEPQKYLYGILQKNISNNDLQHKVKSIQGCIFYYSGFINMSSSFLDGDFLGTVQEANENNINCNYGGLSIGKDGEEVNCYKIDDLNLENLGFIHSDSQGSEPFVFWGAKETIKKYRPIISFENMDFCGDYLYKHILNSYNVAKEIANFDIVDFCINELQYKTLINGHTTYIIP